MSMSLTDLSSVGNYSVRCWLAGMFKIEASRDRGCGVSSLGASPGKHVQVGRDGGGVTNPRSCSAA